MPPRKPSHRLANRRPNRLARRTIELVHGGRLDAAEPPKGLLSASRQAWVEFWASDQAALVRAPDVEALRRLFVLRDEWSRARRALAGNRFVLGSQRQPTLGPAVRYIETLEGLIQRLEDRFGLSPLARYHLGHEAGAAGRSLADLARELDEEENDAEDPRIVAIKREEESP